MTTHLVVGAGEVGTAVAAVLFRAHGRRVVTIPAVLHRIWLDDPLPPPFAEFGSRWTELHPGWDVREWRSTAELPPLRNQDLFDRAREIVPRDWKRFQADLLRLELLDQFGGVYVDCDVEPLKPLDPLLDQPVGMVVAWSPNRRGDGKRLLTQAVLGATPGHPLVRACIDALPGSVARYAGRPLAHMAGPHHLHRVWEADPHGVLPLPEGTFYPQGIRSRDAGETPDLSGAYTHHAWNSSLRRRGKGLG